MGISGSSSSKSNSTGQGRFTYVFRRYSRPFIKGTESVRGMMLDVILALIPVVAWSVFSFGWRALAIVAVSALCSVFFELIYCRISRKKSSVSDLSAVVSGLIFGLTLPVTVPLWLPAAGAFMSVVVFKQLFGGIGKNVINPALCARALLYPAVSLLSVVTPAGCRFNSVAPVLSKEAVASVLGSYEPPSVYRAVDYITGNTEGTIGEISVILIIAAALFLCLRKTVSWHVPAACAGTGLLLIIIPALFGLDINEALTAVLGTLLFNAVFSATDPVTSPVIPAGKLVYGAGCGIIAMALFLIFRISGMYIAVPVMNLLSKPIDRFFMMVQNKKHTQGGLKRENRLENREITNI